MVEMDLVLKVNLFFFTLNFDIFMDHQLYINLQLCIMVLNDQSQYKLYNQMSK